MARFVPTHMPWIKDVGYNFFLCKKVEPMDYICNLVTENFQYDELAILVFTCMYHIHVKIITTKGSWVTNKRKLGLPHEIVLVYVGGKTFLDTKQLVPEPQYSPSIYDVDFNDESEIRSEDTIVKNNSDSILYDTAFSRNIDIKQEFNILESIGHLEVLKSIKEETVSLVGDGENISSEQPVDSETETFLTRVDPNVNPGGTAGSTIQGASDINGNDPGGDPNVHTVGNAGSTTQGASDINRDDSGGDPNVHTTGDAGSTTQGLEHQKGQSENSQTVNVQHPIVL